MARDELSLGVLITGLDLDGPGDPEEVRAQIARTLAGAGWEAEVSVDAVILTDES